MKTFNNRLCEECTNLYIPTGPAARFCSSCSVIKKKESRERERIKRNSGIGSGNSPTNRGTSHPNYKNGIGMYKKIRNLLLAKQGNVCARCETPIDSTKPHSFCGHHKDHDRTNNSQDNIEVICKRCHQIEHECWKAFERATTIPQGSTLK